MYCLWPCTYLLKISLCLDYVQMSQLLLRNKITDKLMCIRKQSWAVFDWLKNLKTDPTNFNCFVIIKQNKVLPTIGISIIFLELLLAVWNEIIFNLWTTVYLNIFWEQNFRWITLKPKPLKLQIDNLTINMYVTYIFLFWKGFWNSAFSF